MRERSRVALLCLNYPPEPTGIAPYAGGLSTGLLAAGYDVRAYTAHPHYPHWVVKPGYGRWRRTEEVNGVVVERLRHYVPTTPRGLRRLLSELSFGARLSFVRLRGPNIVIAISPSLFATAIAMLRVRCMRRRPLLVIWVQDLYTLGLAETGEGNSSALRIARWIESITLRGADRVVVIHQRFEEFAVQSLGVCRQKVEVIRNWTHLPPTTAVTPSSAKARLGWETGFTIAVHTGNMGVKQGLENIVEAARIADLNRMPVHFILLGDGGERRALEKMSHGIGRLTFLDPLSDDLYQLALQAADVLIVNEKPGVGAMAVPSKLTSYFDAGRPIVAATDPNGITASEIAASNAGVVVPAGDPDKLLNAILELRANESQAAEYGLRGRRYRETKLDKQAAINHWVDVLAETIPKEYRSPG